MNYARFDRKRARGQLSAGLLSALLVFAALPAIGQPPEADGAADAEWAAVGVRKFRRAQERPIQLGTSGGNANDFEIEGEYISCVGGTLGGLLEMTDGGVTDQFVLSNNHVLAMVNKARRGDEVIQPALLDSRCVSGPADAVATLSDFQRIRFNGRNKVDMAIAEVDPGAVRSDGKILKLGVPGNTPIEAKLGMQVQKIGRTTGRTRGIVVTLDADLQVEFTSGWTQTASRKVARFDGQIIIRGVNGKPFVEGGDSGSMVYENVKRCPRAVGLVFAGSDDVAAANPISEVLKAAIRLRPKGEKTLVGCSSAPAAALALDEAWPAAASSNPFLARRDELEVRLASRAKRRWREMLFEESGVVGVGVGVEGPTDRRRAVLHVLVERADAETLSRIPTELDGRPVRVIETGRFRAL